MDIAIVDYSKGNLRSVQKGIEMAGEHAFIAIDPDAIARADAVVLPGVGAFEDAARNMAALGQTEVLREMLAADVPFLGICLGLHLLFEWGDESSDGSRVEGIGFLRGGCDRLPQGTIGGEHVKIPHVGWNTVDAVRESPLFDGLPSGAHFYFTHSYKCNPADERDVLARTTHGAPFTSAVSRGNVYGVQFHPEKSSRLGRKMLENFVKIARSA